LSKRRDKERTKLYHFEYIKKRRILFSERLIHGISQAKHMLAAKLSESNRETQEELTRQMEKCCKLATSE
jgi:hypothetical protein